MRVIVGRIGRPHGIRGEVVIGVRTDEPDLRFAAGATLGVGPSLDDDPPAGATLQVAAKRWHSGQLLVAFAGITDRTAAGELTGSWLSVDSSQLPAPPDPDEFRDHELMGLSVRTRAGRAVGVVTDVLHYGQDLLVVRHPDGEEYLVPFVRAIVPEVDVAGGLIVIDPPPGLLDPRGRVEPRPVQNKKRGEGVAGKEASEKRLRIDIVTIFPEYFESPLRVSLIGKAAARGDIEFGVHDLRAWATDVHHSVDDLPFGGGPGMVMKPDVWGDALAEILAGQAGARLVVPTPSGVPFTQDLAARYAAESWLVFACGRYEGIDGRVVEAMRAHLPVDEVSIGDYVLAGGEAAVLVMAEAVGRLLPGVLGNASSAGDDSFGGHPSGGDTAAAMRGLLEGPVYTRPREWRGLQVPEVLLSGHHAAIARWRRDMALRRTAAYRPDLIRSLRDLDRRDRQVLAEAGFPVDEARGFPVSGEDMAH